MSNSLITAHINGHERIYEVRRNIRMPYERGSWPKSALKKRVSKTPNSWPFKHMIAGDCITIPWEHASYSQMESAINGYTKNAACAKFRYRSTPSGLMVWRIKPKGK